MQRRVLPAREFSPQVPGELFRVPTRANGRWSVTYRGTVRLGGIYYTLQTAARQSADTTGTPITSTFRLVAAEP